MTQRAWVATFTSLLVVWGCSSSQETASTSASSGGPDGGAGLAGPEEWNRQVTPPSDDEAATERAACGYTKDSLPAETQGASRPSGDAIPVDHILVMMMENRSFDHYFQKLPEYGQPDVDVAPPTFTNPDADGNPVAPFQDTQYCFVDTNHEWGGVHRQVNGGAMDGFFETNDGWHEVPVHGTLDMISGRRAMGYYDATDLPFYYWAANEFAIADHYHCSLQGPTWPNRMFLYGATSFGKTSNSVPEGDLSIFDYLELREVDWKVYSSGTPGFAVIASEFFQYQAEHRVPLEQYFTDAEAGTLPQVAFIDPHIGAESFDQDDEHPPAVAMIGEALVARVVDALTKSPNWPSSALFVTYDEHGGLYDHVPPPPACPPDDIPPELDPGETGAFDELGVRVPLLVISPFAKKHFVGHQTYDHTSITRFIEARHVIPALTNRDANAEAPWEMFDFEGAPHATPPTVAVPTVDQAKVDACQAIWVE